MTGCAGLHGQVAVIGGGIAGMVCALALAPQPVVLITRAGPGQDSSSQWAQGGIAAVVGPDDDAALHLADTLAAGAGLCDAEIARGILAEGPEAIAALEAWGVVFDRAGQGGYALGLEAAHSRRRILHVDGDGTGAAITRALAAAVAGCPSITVLAGAEVTGLAVAGGAVSGLTLRGEVLRTARVVLATGGLGGLYDATTNPIGNAGQGVAMAARAGAALTDMEFVQFHPTALDAGGAPLGLISEAVRGEGATLVDERGTRFMADVPGAELAPRDVVARAIQARIYAGHRVFLDARRLEVNFATRFPGIARLCRDAGIDPARDPIPVRPAAHYHMGGVATDRHGRSSLPGLWAVGECAATGLHGANRLASNSLLEAVVMARRAAQDLAGVLPRAPSPEKCPPTAMLSVPAPPGSRTADCGRMCGPPTEPVTRIAAQALNLSRNDPDLRAAIATLLPLAEPDGPGADRAIIALSIAVFACLRRETRGAHARTDYPGTDAEPEHRRMTLDELRATAVRLTAPPQLRSA